VPAPTVAETLETSDNRTTSQILTTGAGTTAGDTLIIWYGADAFAVADMPNATSNAGALELLDTIDGGENRGKLKLYTVAVTTAGAKTVTIPAFNGCDIHGFVHRVPAGLGGSLLFDDSTTDFNDNTVNPHAAPTLTTGGADRLLLCCWLNTGSGSFTGEVYEVPAAMTKLGETGASPFSAAAVAGQTIAAGGATGTRSATWQQTARFVAVSAAFYLPADPEVEPEPEPEPSGAGGWGSLLAINQEARLIAAEEAVRRPTACPNDGQPLVTGPNGELFCPFDGWRG
jgi:hypothetical protein